MGLLNTLTQEKLRVFAKTNAAASLNKTGQVVCTEMGFSRFLNVVPVLVNLRSQMSDANYSTFLQSKSLNGIACDGTEQSVKDCSADMDADLATSLYELDIECACKSNFLKKYKFKNF